MIKASDYYRKMLKLELKNEKVIEEKPDLISGLEMMDIISNKGYAIDNTKIICSNGSESKGNLNEEIKPQGCLDKLSSLFFFTSEKVKNSTFDITNNVRNIDIKQKFYETGKGTIDIIKNLGGTVVDKSKEIYNSKKIRYLFDKTDEKINYIVDKTKSIFVGEEDEEKYSQLETNDKMFKIRKKHEIIKDTNVEYAGINKNTKNSYLDVIQNNAHEELDKTPESEIKLELFDNTKHDNLIDDCLLNDELDEKNI